MYINTGLKSVSPQKKNKMGEAKKTLFMNGHFKIRNQPVSQLLE